MGFLERILHWGDGTLERTSDSDLFQTQVDSFWGNLASATGASNPTLLERVWVANRCLQLNANAVSTMPLRHYGQREPAWVSNPDPNWYPNGIGDAVFSIVWSLYGWGDAFVYITSRYADGYPAAWTVLDPAPMSVEVHRGQRSYRSGQNPMNAEDMVQISRDPRGGLRGTSAIASYAAYSNGLLAAADMGRVMMTSGVPNAVLKSNRKLTAEQAEAIQEQWVGRTAVRRGAPAVLPPDITFEQLAFSPADLMLLDAQKFDAQVLATAFGVPAQMINMSIEGGLNYTTPVLMLEQWWRDELRPTALRISRALSTIMLPRGAYVEFDAREFLAPTFPELVASHLALFAAGAITLEELRTAVLGIPPSASEQEALDVLTVPPSAGASPSKPTEVIPLRPTQAVNQ